MLYRRWAKQKPFLNLKYSLIIFAVVAIVLVGSIDRPLIVSPLQKLALNVSAGLAELSHKPADWLAVLSSKEKLAEENSFLKYQFDTLTTYCTVRVQGLEAAKSDLESALGRRSLSEKILATGMVIGKPPVSAYGTVIIDAGRSSGVQKGDLAFAGDYLIGQVDSVSEDIAVVNLFGQKGDKQILLVGDNRLPLHGEGMGYGAYSAEYINKTLDISGQNARLALYPNYLYAVVINNDGAEKYTIILRSPVNILALASIDIVRYENK